MTTPVDRVEAVERLLKIEVLAKEALIDWERGALAVFPHWADPVLSIIKGLPPT
jgi:hypothetical protein